MTGTTCVVCKRTKIKGDAISMHRIPACASNRKEWMDRLNLDEASLKAHHRICSSHFPNGDQTQRPSLALDAKFASPKKKSTERCERALKRKALFVVPKPKRHVKSKTTTNVSVIHAQILPCLLMLVNSY